MLAQLDQCQNHASADFNPLHWIVTSVYPGSMCSIKTAGVVVAVSSSDAAPMSGLQTKAALGLGLAGLPASGILLLTPGPTGDQKDQTITLPNGSVVTVSGQGKVAMLICE